MIHHKYSYLVKSILAIKTEEGWSNWMGLLCPDWMSVQRVVFSARQTRPVIIFTPCCQIKSLTLARCHNGCLAVVEQFIIKLFISQWNRLTFVWWPNSRYLMTDFVLPDGPSMDGLILLQHHHQGSYDSTDSGSLPPTYSRLPPDGHEFPEGESPSVFSTLIGRGPTRLGSHWSRAS